MTGMARVAVVGLEPPRRLPAVEHRQAHVHQDQVGRFGSRHRRRPAAPSTRDARPRSPCACSRRDSMSRFISLSSTSRIFGHRALLAASADSRARGRLSRAVGHVASELSRECAPFCDVIDRPPSRSAARRPRSGRSRSRTTTGTPAARPSAAQLGEEARSRPSPASSGRAAMSSGSCRVELRRSAPRPFVRFDHLPALPLERRAQHPRGRCCRRRRPAPDAASRRRCRSQERGAAAARSTGLVR